MSEHIRKSVSLPRVVYETVKSIAEVEGRSFSDVLSTVVRSVIEGEEGEVVKVFKDKLRLAELKAIAHEIRGKKVALEQLSKLEDEINREIEKTELEVKIAILMYYLERLWTYMDRHGAIHDAETQRYVQKVNKVLREQFNKQFDFKQFVNDYWGIYTNMDEGLSKWFKDCLGLPCEID